MLEVNQTVPNFSFQATSGCQASLQDYRDKTVVLYFYPKDATPGCTTQAQNFRDLYAEFESNNTVIFGVSRDSMASHEKFKKNQQLPFELISDSDESLCQLFDVIKEKSMFGKKYMGIERSTFIIAPDQTLMYLERKVKVTGHVQKILSLVREQAA